MMNRRVDEIANRDLRIVTRLLPATVAVAAAGYLFLLAASPPVFADTTRILMFAHQCATTGPCVGDLTSVNGLNHGTLWIRFFAWLLTLGFSPDGIHVIVVGALSVATAIAFVVLRTDDPRSALTWTAIYLVLVTLVSQYPKLVSHVFAPLPLALAFFALDRSTSRGGLPYCAVAGAGLALAAKAHVMHTALLCSGVFFTAVQAEAPLLRTALLLAGFVAVAPSLGDWHRMLDGYLAGTMLAVAAIGLLGFCATRRYPKLLGGMASSRRLLALAFIFPVAGTTILGIVGRGFPGTRYFAAALLPALSLLAVRRSAARRMPWAVGAVALALPLVIERLGTMAVRCPVMPQYEYREMQALGAALESRALPATALGLRGPYAAELVAGLSPFVSRRTRIPGDDIRVLRVRSEVGNRLTELGWTTIPTGAGDAIAFSSLPSRLRLDHARTCLRTAEDTRCADATPEAWSELDDPTRWATAYDTLPSVSALFAGPRAIDPEVEVTQRVPLTGDDGPRLIRLFSSGFEPPWEIVAVDDAEFRGRLPGGCVVLGRAAGNAGAITFRVRGPIDDLPIILAPPFLEMTEPEDVAVAATLTDSPVVRAVTKKQVTPCGSDELAARVPPARLPLGL